MPIPFDELENQEPQPRVASWLRFVEDANGTGVNAALFQTTETGEAVDFCFTRAELREFGGSGHAARGRAVGYLLKKLLPEVASSPTLALGLADEIPAWVFNEAVQLRIPFCLISASPDSADVSSERLDGDGLSVVWQGDRPPASTDAKRLFDEVMAWDDSLEPFRRADKALAEAFADEHVKALASVAGLSTVVTLHSMESGERLHEHEPTAAVSLPQRTNPSPDSQMTLAQRLWAVLRAPPVRLRQVRLERRGELMPFQRDGVQALMENRCLLLADDMGLGKTIQAIVALRLLRAQREIASCLVAAPAGVLDQWRRELDKWAPELSAIIIRGSASDREWQWKADRDVILVSYDTLRSDFSSRDESMVRLKTWDVVVADEAQRVKNRNSTSDALKGLRRRRSWALTGTPVENDEEELASIMEFVDQDEAGMTRRYRAGWELRERHQELQLRRKKSDVLEDLPPKQETKISIQLGSRQRNSYEKAEQDGIVYLKSLGTEISVGHVLELITRLKQICNADPKTGESSKLSDIKQRLGQLAVQGHKALVFSQYTSDHAGVAAAARYLQEFSPLTITGDMPQEDRDGAIRRFRDRPEHKVLILSLRAGGLGLNLQEASYVFHLDRWWNPAVERQAEDRSHRLGQTVKVNVIKYSCAGTIEERIDRILESKQEVFDRLVDDVSLDISAQMSSQELFGLFGLEVRVLHPELAEEASASESMR